MPLLYTPEISIIIFHYTLVYLVLRSLASLFSCVLLCVCDCVCVQGLALHQGTRLVDPEAGDFKRAVLPAHRELTLAVVA